MTTGRINQVSAYHLRPASARQHCKVTNGISTMGLSKQTSNAQALHQRMAYPFESKGKAQGKTNACLGAQTSLGKLAPTLQISQTHTAQQVQTHKLELLKHQNALQFEAALLTTHNRDRMR